MAWMQRGAQINRDDPIPGWLLPVACMRTLPEEEKGFRSPLGRAHESQAAPPARSGFSQCVPRHGNTAILHAENCLLNHYNGLFTALFLSLQFNLRNNTREAVRGMWCFPHKAIGGSVPSPSLQSNQPSTQSSGCL